MSQEKSSTPKIDRRTSANIKVTRTDVLHLFKAITKAGPGSSAGVDVLGHIDDVMNNSPAHDPASNKELFLKFFLEGWPQSSYHTRRNAGEIIQRIRAGQSIEEIHNHFQREWRKIRAANRKKERNQPEPEDKTSAEWRYWKLRRMESMPSAGHGKSLDNSHGRESEPCATTRRPSRYFLTSSSLAKSQSRREAQANG
jgi:hypothetical protein